MVDSTWVLEPKAPDVGAARQAAQGRACRAVNVVYVGPLKDAWTLEPRITADQLERELAIRKMELDAEQLERLHKLDAERARQEEERRKALDAEKRRSARRRRLPRRPRRAGAPPAAAGATGRSRAAAAAGWRGRVPSPLEDRGTAADVPLPPGQANAVPAAGVDAIPAFNATGCRDLRRRAAGAVPQASPVMPLPQPAPQDSTHRPRRAVRRAGAGRRAGAARSAEQHQLSFVVRPASASARGPRGPGSGLAGALRT